MISKIDCRKIRNFSVMSAWCFWCCFDFVGNRIVVVIIFIPFIFCQIVSVGGMKAIAFSPETFTFSAFLASFIGDSFNNFGVQFSRFWHNMTPICRFIIGTFFRNISVINIRFIMIFDGIDQFCSKRLF